LSVVSVRSSDLVRSETRLRGNGVALLLSRRVGSFFCCVHESQVIRFYDNTKINFEEFNGYKEKILKFMKNDNVL
jgi:hypothetical protein